MPKVNSFSNHKIDTFPNSGQGRPLGIVSTLYQGLQAILKSFVVDREIIHEHLHDLLDQIREYHHHAPLK
jgi:hypothetical protein